MVIGDSGVLGPEKCGPTAVRIKLGIGAEQLLPAGASTVNTLSIFIKIAAGARALSTRLPQNIVFAGIQAVSPISLAGVAGVKITHRLTFLGVIFAYQFARQPVNFLVRTVAV